MLLKRLSTLRKPVQRICQNNITLRWNSMKTLQPRSQALLLNDSGFLPQLFFTRLISSSQRDPDVKWLFPASPFLEFMEEGNKLNTYVACLIFTLHAASPISSDDMMKVLHGMYRKVSYMRMCLRKDQDQLWVCELTSPPQFDFKVVEGSDWKREAEKIFHQGFDSYKGPLWRARLIPDAGTLISGSERTKVHPYQYKLIFGIYSGTHRGIIVVKFINLLMDLLNCRTSKNDENDIGRYMSEEELFELEKIFNSCRETFPPHVRAEIDERLALNHQPLLVEAFKVPKDTVDATGFKSYEVSLESSKKIFSECRSKKLTVNSFMVSLINAAIVQTMKDAGFNQANFNVSSCSAVDARRYMESDVARVQNAATLKLIHLKSTPNHVVSSFWDYASEVHTELQSRLAQKYPIYESIVTDERMTSNRTYKDYYTGDNLVEYDYFISNFGAMSITFWKEEEEVPVQLSQVDMIESIHHRGIPCFIIVNSLNGQLRFTTTYSTKYMTEETVNNLHNNMSKVISVLFD